MQDHERDWLIAEDDSPARPAHWHCQSCGHHDYTKPMPRDREAYFANPKPGKCPRCRSEDMATLGY